MSRAAQRKKGLSFSIPMPRYFSVDPVGIDISDRSFKYVKLSGSEGNRTIDFYGEGEIPEGAIKEGEIIDQKSVVDALRRALEGKVKSQHPIVFSLPDEKAFSRPLTLPRMRMSEVRSAVGLQIEEIVPLEKSEVIFDFEIVEGGGTAKTLDVVVSAYPQKIVDAYLTLFIEARLKPIVAESESRALSRITVPKTERGSVMVVDIGRTRASFFMVYEQVVRYTATVAIAGERVTKTLAEQLGVSAEEAEKKKQQMIIGRGEKKIDDAFAPIIKELTDAINERISFWDSYVTKNSEDGKQLPALRKIYLVGGESRIRGLDRMIGANIQIPVLLAEPWRQIFNVNEYIPEITAEDTLRFGTALGLAMRKK